MGLNILQIKDLLTVKQVYDINDGLNKIDKAANDLAVACDNFMTSPTDENRVAIKDTFDTWKNTVISEAGSNVTGALLPGNVGDAVGLTGWNPLGKFIKGLEEKYSAGDKNAEYIEELLRQGGLRTMKELSPLDRERCKKVDKKYGDAGRAMSPLILDLNGDGVQTTDSEAGAYFDHDGDGFAEQTGWVAPGDGLLVRDLDGNGQIDTGRELFGNQTQLANGANAANGFDALTELDSNQDGKIDAADSAFSTLQVWQDANGDGLSSADELLTLTEVGVQSISTGYTADAVTDPQGNAHKQIGTYTTTTGATRAAEDVWFQVDKTYTIATEWLDVPETIAALPDLAGYGNVHDLHQAMVRDTTGELKALVERFGRAANHAERMAA